MKSRVIPLLPRAYHNGDGLIPFVELLEPEVGKIEELTAELTNLAGIDKIPDKYLPYIASKTNAPLMGNDPKLWRRQIRMWPEILSIKGTERSLKLFFRALGFARYDILTYWRDADGNYTTEKPEGEPFKGEDSVWYNSRTHYFSVRLWWTPDSDVGTEADSDILAFLRKWLPKVKPAYAELLEWDTRLAIVEFYDNLRDELFTDYAWGLNDAVTMTDPGHESLTARAGLALAEYVWAHHAYSDEGLEYDHSGITYNREEVEIERLNVRPCACISETARGTEGIVNALYLIIK